MVVMETALASFEVLVGQHAASDVTGLDTYTRCHHHSGSIPAGATEKIDCDDDSLQGRYVAVIKRDSDVTLEFCELEVATAPGSDTSKSTKHCAVLI